jgi:hypothetical protein
MVGARQADVRVAERFEAPAIMPWQSSAGFLNLAQPEITRRWWGPSSVDQAARAVNFTFKGLIIIIWSSTSAFSFLKTEARIRRCRHYR